MLYDLYKDRVYSIALYFFHGDQTNAADVTQQVFLKLITAIPKYKGDSAFSTWLYRLVVNTCLDAARRRKNTVASTFADLTAPGSQEDDLVRSRGPIPSATPSPRCRRNSESPFSCGILTTSLTNRWPKHSTARWAR